MEQWLYGFRTDMKMAIRTVKSGWKTYSAIFVAVFMIQALFGIIGFSHNNSTLAERDTILADYDSHVELTSLPDADYHQLLARAAATEHPYFEVIHYSQLDGIHTVGLYFNAKPETCLATFVTEFAEMFENGVVYTETPLFAFDNADAGGAVRHGVLLTFMGVISLVLLTILNNTRINHFKFGYGIYMSFGADFKRLARNTVCESLFILAVTYLPAMIFSFAAVAIMTLLAGGEIVFSVMPLVWALLIPLVAAVLATAIPIRWLTTRRPCQVLLAADNSNRVISPRRSRMIFATRFPRIPELLSLFRFSGFGLRLMLSGTLFSLLFTCGIYAVSYYDKTLDLPFAQYTITMNLPNDDFVAEMEAIEGVTVLDGERVLASECYSHLLVNEDMVKSGEGFLPYPQNDSLMATHKVVYRCADKGLPEALADHYNYKVDGDPTKVLTDPNSIILSDSVSGRKMLDVKPGDTVYLAVGGSQHERYDPDLLYADDGVLRVHLTYYTFSYRAFTVAAVIRNEPDREGMCIYLPSDVYTEMTSIDDDTWSVYVSDTLSDSEFEKTDKKLQNMLTQQLGVTYQNHETRELRELNLSHNYTAVYTSVFCLVLSLVPLMWFFTLLLFNEKRKVELDVYRALGATHGELKRLFVLDGCIYAVLAAVFYAVLAPVCTGYLQRVLTSDIFFTLFLPSYSDKPVYLSVYPGGVAYAVGIALTALSAFAASYLSYRLYQKKESEHISENFSQEE